ncbi:tetratricopeptide repeat protein [Parvibaculaceae bacterium PLY_AMNH_Bact1]|nr:tetratricopeptide repeat protein [Parvibaculaceae bacterium PLY_AMNH_Bact1]
MTYTDAFGSDVTLDKKSTLDHWNRVSRAFLSHSSATPNHLASVLEEAPTFALAHAFQGISYLTLGRKELIENARMGLANAKQAVATVGCTKREGQYIEALETWLAGHPVQAAAVMDDVLAETPGDAMALKLGHAIRFILGDAKGMRRSLEAVLPVYDNAHPATGYVLGCHAFSAEETGDYELAEAQGRKGLEMAPDDAWGLHAIAHVFDMTGQPMAGAGWLGGQTERWAHCNNFGFHVWWHLALFLLAIGATDEVLDLYDQKFRAEHTDDYRDISNAASMLVRLEIEGVSVGNRWEELTGLCEKRTQDGCVVFADLHYIMPLARLGRREAADALIETLTKNATSMSGHMSSVARTSGVPAARGILAYYRGNYREAYRDLAAARPSMQSVGGSHAQRDVFERLTVDAATRAGLLDDAIAILQDREKNRGAPDAFSTARLKSSKAEAVDEEPLVVGVSAPLLA